MQKKKQEKLLHCTCLSIIKIGASIVELEKSSGGAAIPGRQTSVAEPITGFGGINSNLYIPRHAICVTPPSSPDSPPHARPSVPSLPLPLPLPSCPPWYPLCSLGRGGREGGRTGGMEGRRENERHGGRKAGSSDSVRSKE